MKKPVYHGGNFVYIINKDHQIVDFNDIMAGIYPNLRRGDLCHKELMGQSEPCQACPLGPDGDDDLTVYNQDIEQWVSVKRAWIDYPGQEGTCGMIMAGAIRDMNKSVANRVPTITGYDLFIEMNLTQDTYRVMFRENNEIKEFSNENLKTLYIDTANRLVHPADKERFLSFWDVDTLLARIEKSHNEIKGSFRERNENGHWDEVSITIVPEEYIGTTDVYVMALYQIRPWDEDKIPPQDSLYNDANVTRDRLTGLPLRRSFWELVDRFNAGDGTEYCMIVTDVMHFHVFNKWFGRETGDRLLQAIGKFLLEFGYRTGAYSGYIGGDNFCTVFPYNEKHIEELQTGITGLIAHFEDIKGFKPIFGAYKALNVNAIAVDAYDCCMTAISRNKEDGNGKLFWFDDRMAAELSAELDLIPRIQEAMVNEEVTFYLQPKCDMMTGRIVGSEALVRWFDPDGKSISPASFIPALEKNGFITELDYYVWDRVCKTIADWKQNGIPVLPVSVNVSRVDIFTTDVVSIFHSLIEKYNLSSRDIQIEITESAFVSDELIIQEVENGLKQLGFTILIDDFGSGYSSLNMLKNIDADILKLDMRFLDLDDKNQSKGSDIIISILEMAERLGLTTIAEGVETNEQRLFLEDLGCHLAQGYYFYKPMPVPEYESLLYQENIILLDRRDASEPAKKDAIVRHVQYLPSGNEPYNYQSFQSMEDDLAEYLKCISSVWDLCRLVDVRSMTEYVLEDGGRISAEHRPCFEIWNRGGKCSECISKQAVHTGIPAARFDFMDQQIVYVIARPIRVGKVIYSLETGLVISDERFYTIFGRRGLSDAMRHYSDRIYLDPLTGAYNYIYYAEQINWSRIAAMAIIDLDNFKSINNTYGHRTGDKVLQHCANSIRAFIRDNDILIRYGGDEFLLVMNHITSEAFAARLEEICTRIRQIRILNCDGLSISCSIGGLICDQCTPINMKLLDSKLHQAKKSKDTIII